MVSTLLYVLRLSACQRLYCPLSCVCVFDAVLEDNMATCRFGNTRVEITYQQGARRGERYMCADWPRFNVTNSDAELHIERCTADALRCAGHAGGEGPAGPQLAESPLLGPGTVLDTLHVLYPLGAFSAADFVGFERVHYFNLNLEDEGLEVPASAFRHLTRLTRSYITGGMLQLSRDVLHHKVLGTLYLISNNIKEIPPYAFNGLPKLKSLNLQSNLFKHLGAESFRGLTSLKILQIENNTLSTIDPYAFSSLKRLVFVRLFENKLTLIPNGLFTGLNNLHKVYVKNNQVEMKLDAYVFANLPSITLVMMWNCKISYLPENLFNGSTNIATLDLSENHIEALPPKLLATNPGLEYVFLQQNKIKELPDNIFAANHILQQVNLGYNLLSSLKRDTFTHSSKLIIVILEHNRLTHIDAEVFNGTALNSLILAHNNLRRPFTGNSYPGWSTRYLSLSHNELSLFEDWFLHMNQLEELDLSTNKIELIKESHIIHHNKSKFKIDLRHNRITTILRDVSDTQVLLASLDVTVYLSDNPIVCDCIVTKLLKQWNDYGMLGDYDNITCSDGDKLSNLNVYIQCNKIQALIGVVGSSVVGAFVALLLLIYIISNQKHLWEFVLNILSVWKFETHNKTDARNDSLEMTREVGKLYDLFVSFAHEDSDFVTNKLLPVLEHELNLKICVHYRDWVVGDLISEQIRDSVENSTMTLIVLTEHFLLSEWSSLEFRTAHNLSVEDGKQRLIIILLDEAVSRHEALTTEMKIYLGVNTYLLFEDLHFWEKIQKVLPRKNKKKI